MSISEPETPNTTTNNTRLLRRVDRVISDLRRGLVAIVEGGSATLALQAAETATAASLAQLTALGGGKLSLALTRRRAAALGLTAMPSEPRGSSVLALPRDTQPQFVHTLADPGAAVAGLGVDAPDGDRLVDAAIELVKLTRLLPAAVIVPLTPAAAKRIAKSEDVLTVAADDILAYEAEASHSMEIVSEARVPLADAENTRLVHFRPRDGGVGHIAIVIGDPDPAKPVLVRLHSECFTGDLLGSLRCDCGDQLRGAIAEIAKSGGGAVLYLSQEGRGIGLANKLRAYRAAGCRLRHGRCQRAVGLRCR